MVTTEWLRTGDAWDFIETLCGLTPDAWLDSVRRLHSAAGSDAARRKLYGLVRQDGLAHSVWSLHDGIDTAVWYASQNLQGAGIRRRRSLSRKIIEASRTAALALLFRRQLGERCFWLLYEPFQAVCPQRRLQLDRRASRVFTESLCAIGLSVANVQE